MDTDKHGFEKLNGS